MTITEQVIEELIKSHKYSRKEFKNGTWFYYYNKHNNFGRITQCKSSALTFKINKNLSEKDKCKQVEQQAVDYINNVWLKDWQNTTPNDKSICMELRNKKVVFEGISYKHISMQGKNSNGGRAKRALKNMLDHVKYLPCAKEMLESSGVWTHARYEEFKNPYTDKITGKKVVGIIYQSVTGAAPKGDKSNNYVQATVSKIKYADNTYGSTVYISVMGMKDIKKSTALSPCLQKEKDGMKVMKPVHSFGSAATYSIPCGEGGMKSMKSIHAFGRTATDSVHASNIPHNNNNVNRSISISISDITEGNRYAKFEQLEKCLGGGVPEYIPADNTPSLGTINIKIKDYSRERIEKALRTMAMSLSVPLKAAKGEAFTFKAQEDLTDKWAKFFSDIVRKTYDFVIEYFDLPKITVMSKAVNLTWKGKVLYSPESGEPITQKEWDFFVKNLEKFLNRNVSNAAERIVLDSKALGHILDRMLKTNTLENIKKQNLESLKYNGKTFDWISESVKNMKNALGESLTRQETARIAVIQQSAAEKITKITDGMKSDVKQILIDGVVDHKSKSQVSQALFDKMVGHNRDFQRIADTEIQRTFNNSFIREEVYNAAEGEKVYFERVEVVDGNTCPYCKMINGKIAVWSNTPLASGAVKDEYADLAIWEGKEWDGKKLERIADAPISVVHPYCRGTWIRYYPELDGKKKKKENKK